LAGISALAWFGPALPRAFCLYVDTVSRIPTPGALFRTKFAEWGLDTANFLRIPNLFDVEAVACDDSRGNAFVYFGRVGAGKGLATRLRAVARARSKLRVVGTGPDDKSLRRLAQQTRAEIEFCGKLSAGALRTAIARVHAVAVPLDWYENAPVDLMEASALARPVVGTCIGGIPELIRDDETGVLFESGAEDALAAVLERVRALSDLTLAKKGHADREWMRAEFMPLAYRDHMLAL
jgi:glycosyltransferase involved in cell wall biosynthesis